MLRRSNVNAVIIALYLFQYALLIPIMSLVNPTTAVALCSVLLVVVYLFFNRTVHINMVTFLLYAGITFALILKILVDDTSISILYYFIAIAFPAFILFCNPFNCRKFLEVCGELALFNFALLFTNPFFGRYEYMRFGYGMVLTPIFTFLRLFYLNNTKFRWIQLTVLVISLIEVALYGARGCILVFLLFFLLYTFFVSRQNIMRNILIAGGLMIAVSNIVPILNLLQRISNALGIYSYALRKYQLQLKAGFESASSGRSALYARAFELIKRHPVFGNPIVFTEDEGIYVHNLLLQAGQDFGIVVLLAVVLFVIVSLIKISDKNGLSDQRVVLTALFSISVGRLMLSSIYWKRPEFWMLVCFQLSYSTIAYRADQSFSGGHCAQIR